jgi:hypothetical protein
MNALRAALALLTGAALAVSAAAQGIWARVPATGEPMSGRSSPAAAALGSQVYLFGGVRDDFRSGRNVFHDDLHRFDTGSGRWTRLSPAGAVPPPRAFAAAVPVPHRRWMLVFGGALYADDFSSFTAYDDLWAYDVPRNQWTQLRSVNAGPPGRVRPSMWHAGDRVYVFGGATAAQRALNDLWMFDLHSRRWTLLVADGAAGAPPARLEAYAASEAALGKLTVYGGLSGADTGYVGRNDTWQFDLHRRRWTDVTPPAEAGITPSRDTGSAAILAFSLYVHGGDLPGGSSGCGAVFPQNPTSELWRFDLLRLQWQKLAPGGDAAPRLKRTAAVRVGARMFVFGGFDFACPDESAPGQAWNDAVFSYSPFTSPQPPAQGPAPVQ